MYSGSRLDAEDSRLSSFLLLSLSSVFWWVCYYQQYSKLVNRLVELPVAIDSNSLPRPATPLDQLTKNPSRLRCQAVIRGGRLQEQATEGDGHGLLN